MTTIPTASGSNYQLPNQNKAQGSDDSPISARTNGANANVLMQGGSAYMLDLSEEARNYLTSGTMPTPEKLTGKERFSLSEKQQQQIEAIIGKYKDAPVTQQTYDQIQFDLREAYLAPDQLSMQHTVSSFNATQSLLDAMGGDFSEMGGIDDASSQDPANKTRSSNYMVDIVSHWQDVSSQYTGPVNS